jgi:propionyl-CoA synthetase
MQSILNNDQLYIDKYFKTFPGFYNTGDSGMVDEDGYVSIMSRVDDVINTAGHRMSTGEMEQAIMTHDKIAEAVVIGVFDEIKGELPVGFVTIKTGREFTSESIEKEVVALIRK